MGNNEILIKSVKIYAAIIFALFSGSISSITFAAEAEDVADSQLVKTKKQKVKKEKKQNDLEEVVVTGSRLQGSAQAVLEERKQQAFVADILGTEQISRSGDSDAAAALRRVTGLTLVDGKYIYIRGLGERYSSTLLNNSTVPSPDPTRSVLPLDLFPSSIIESLSVQKSWSPDLPAHFAGGNVNVRTKSIPTEKILKFSIKLGTNTDNKSSPFYAGGSDDALGNDDGTRALPEAFRQAFATTGIDSLAPADAVSLLSSLNRNISAKEVSPDPDVSLGLSIGGKMDVGEVSQLGILAAISYKNEWQISNERNVNNLAITTDGIRINEFDDGKSTEHKVKWSGMVNMGYDYDENNHIELNNLYLKDTKDRLRDRDHESTNTINEPDLNQRRIDILYEERELLSTQLKGQHNFPNLMNLGLDWFYTKSSTKRNAPGGFETTFRLDTLDNGSGPEVISSIAQDVDTRYSFQNLKDNVDDYGINISLPLYFDDWNVEFKAGSDFIKKDRKAENIDITIQTFSIPQPFLVGTDFSQIFSDNNLAQNGYTVRFNDATSDGDKYQAAQLIDSYYFMGDFEMGSKWRFTGGVRNENFRQVAIPFKPHSDFFSATTAEIAQLPLTENKLYPSLAVTYILDSTMQFRLNYSETTIRPDFRDVTSAFYVDPLTEFLVRGSTSLKSSTVNNYDFRWEWYLESGENLSVALFRKDITNPIEQIELPSATEGAPLLLTANGDDGFVQGVEFEFLKDFSFLGDNFANYFTTGNLTFSDSEVNICSSTNVNSTCLFEEQLKEALNTSESVTNVITNNTRSLIGHSKWVANLQLGWDSLNGEHSATLVYNVFGPRIIVPGVNGFEDAKEQSFNSLDLIYTWFPTYSSTVKARIKNILNEDKVIKQNGVDLLRETVGTAFSIQYSQEF